MSIITYPLNHVEYTAEDAELYHSTRTSGVFAGDEDFPITVSGTGNVVTIGEGIAWIRNSKFSGKVVANKRETSLSLGLPHDTYPRIDAVVLQFDANANATNLIVKNGTATTNPIAPSVTRTESVYELHLYHVYRPAGASSVISSNVTDLRTDPEYCGVMSDNVTMLGDDYIKKDMIGAENGVVPLNGSAKIDNFYLNTIPISKGGTGATTAAVACSNIGAIPTSQKGIANGIAPLDGSKKVPIANIPYSSSVSSSSNSTVATSSAVKEAYDKAIEAAEFVSETTTSDGVSVSYYKCGRIVVCNITISLDESWGNTSFGINLPHTPSINGLFAAPAVAMNDLDANVNAELVVYSGVSSADVVVAKNYQSESDVVVTFVYIAEK